MNKETLFLQEWAERYPHSAAALVEALKATPQGIAVYIPLNRQSVNDSPPEQELGKLK